jgi:hypothetical protein
MTVTVLPRHHEMQSPLGEAQKLVAVGDELSATLSLWSGHDAYARSTALGVVCDVKGPSRRRRHLHASWRCAARLGTIPPIEHYIECH